MPVYSYVVPYYGCIGRIFGWSYDWCHSEDPPRVALGHEVHEWVGIGDGFLFVVVGYYRAFGFREGDSLALVRGRLGWDSGGRLSYCRG